MNYQEEYSKWLESDVTTAEEHEILESIRQDPDGIKELFFAPLAFGTGGLRGIMGPGINRMNVYVVQQTTQALANLILRDGSDAAKAGVAICHDSRNNSMHYARAAACVLVANGIHVKLFRDLRPTPELSFAILHYSMTAGINITASHNPKQYNGYKCYWKDGAQMPPDHADIVSSERQKIDVLTGAKTIPFEEATRSGLLEWLDTETDELYLKEVLKQAVAPDAVAAVADSFHLVYTPFHGAGYRLVPEALKRLGLLHVISVPEQSEPDGDFPTVKSPNPEDKAGFALAIELAKKEDANLIIGTDPDADRAGIVVRDPTGAYVPLTGNQVGVLLLDYLIRVRGENGTLPAKPVVLKTIVTTEMARAVAAARGVPVYDTFTGFKFLCEKMGQLSKEGKEYLLAFEESYGYLAGDYARDKDAVVASVLIAEMACWYATKNMSLFDALDALFAEFGTYQELTLNLVMPGVSGMEKMAALMSSLRKNPPKAVGSIPVRAFRDYIPGTREEFQTGKTESLELKNADVLYFEMEDGTNWVIRPSGTEPKVKVYILAKGESKQEVGEKIKQFEAFAQTLSK
jgi:phosphoglucomutase